MMPTANSYRPISALAPGTPFSRSSHDPHGLSGCGKGVGGYGAVEMGQELSGLRHPSQRGPAEDADDAAHSSSGYRPALVPIRRLCHPKRANTMPARLSAVVCAKGCVAASTITRISGSVPLGRTRMRPSPFSDCVGDGDLVGKFDVDIRMPVRHLDVDENLRIGGHDPAGQIGQGAPGAANVRRQAKRRPAAHRRSSPGAGR